MPYSFESRHNSWRVSHGLWLKFTFIVSLFQTLKELFSTSNISILCYWRKASFFKNIQKSRETLFFRPLATLSKDLFLDENNQNSRHPKATSIQNFPREKSFPNPPPASEFPAKFAPRFPRKTGLSKNASEILS